jgi:DNA polymerase-1
MARAGVQLSFFEPGQADAAENGTLPPTVTRRIDSLEGLAELCRRIEAVQRVAFDTETTGVDMTRCELIGISIATAPGEAFYVPIGDANTEAWSIPLRSAPLHQLQAALNRSRMLVAHNAKFDLGVLKRAGLPITATVYDTLIAQFLIDPLRKNGYGLKTLAHDYLGWRMTQIEELIGHGRAQGSLRDVPVALTANYAGADADATYRLVDLLDDHLDRLALRRLFNEVELPLVPVLVDMELCGVPIDVPYLNQYAGEISARVIELEREIYRLAGYRFNVGSPQQLSHALFNVLGLPIRLGDEERGPSTRAHRLEQLRSKHAVIPLILEHRELSKLYGTYARALPEQINPLTGRVHTTFNQAVVITGRLSSSNPNLQNIPITTDLGRRVRKAFVARPGGQVISADYSQVELRLLAHLANDTALRAAFERNEDIHASTAAAIYGVPLVAVSSEQRSFAKRVNFGICYGMGAYSLARSADMSEADAVRFIENYFRRFSGVKRWLDRTKRKMADEGFVASLYGRRRPFESMAGRRTAEVRRAERLAINHPVQGAAADVIKLAMINLHRRLLAEGYASRMTLQVHDELVLDVAPGEEAAMCELVRQEMEQAVPLSVPLKADLALGPNWNDAVLLSA